MDFHPLSWLNFWDSFNFPSFKWSEFDWPELAFSQMFDLDWKKFSGSWMPVRPSGRKSAESARFSASSGNKNDPNMYSVKLDVSHFFPNEITVKTADKNIIVTGKHEERRDGHGWITREFTRRYPLPEGCEEDTVSSSLTPGGILVIEAPKKMIDMPKGNERIVPITIKGKESINTSEEKKESIEVPEEKVELKE